MGCWNFPLSRAVPVETLTVRYNLMILLGWGGAVVGVVAYSGNILNTPARPWIDMSHLNFLSKRIRPSGSAIRIILGFAKPFRHPAQSPRSTPAMDQLYTSHPIEYCDSPQLHGNIPDLGSCSYTEYSTDPSPSPPMVRTKHAQMIFDSDADLRLPRCFRASTLWNTTSTQTQRALPTMVNPRLP